MQRRSRAVTIPYRRPASIIGASPDYAEDETVKLQPRTRTVLAWSLWLATFGCLAGGLVATLIWTRPLSAGVLVEGAANAFVFWLPFATIGLVLALRRPANPIGWLYGAAGLLWTLTVPWDPWVDQLIATHRPLPLAAQLAALAADNLWAPAITLGVTLPLLLLPNGRLRSRRWRVVVATGVVGVTIAVVGWSLMPQPLTQTPVPVDKPFALDGVGATVATVFYAIGTALHWGSLPAAAVCVVLRFRASRGVERQQLRWVAAGAAGVVAGLALLPVAAAGILPAGESIFPSLLLLSVPVAVAVAVLRYRLWDLDRLVSRTVTYALITVLLVSPYLLILPAITRLAGDAGSLAVAAATLAAAAAFSPLRRRVQDLVDRRFNRARYDATRTVEAFAARLREQVDLDALSAELLAAVEQTVAPTRASLWLRPPVNLRLPRSAATDSSRQHSLVNPTPKAL
jgi:hypothetical protein